MKTQVFKTSALTITSFMVLGFAILGTYNTAIVNNDPFSESKGFKFVKRLDEINGKVIVGRMAASAASWINLENKKEEKKALVKEEVKKVLVSENNFVPAPAIKEDLDLTLNKAFFKEPLKEGTFVGSARTVDGVIEEVNVTLPTGQVININTRDRMIGNVFTYEDSYTREARSGMFYEVKKGTYMITLTNDSQFAGTRLEFVAQNDTEVRYADEYYEENIGWGVESENGQEAFAARDNSVQEPVESADYQFNFNG